ncbi:mechanosensitive ion channel domain-containing protein [Psychromonas sp.]|uniref:mechanosensitive ion channel domain-containing protein n=1 Tax=Psychromonas sp. TaxID=1884585 RepID=UPI003566A65F
MKKASRLILLAAVIFFSCSGLTQTVSSVTVDTLNERIEAATKSQEYDAETQAALIQLYRDSIANQHLIQQYTTATEKYQETLLSAPQEINSLKKIQEERLAKDPLAALKINQYTNLANLEKLISDEEINRAESEAKLSSINTRIEASTSRPSQARERINSVRQEMAQLSEKQMDPQANKSPLFTEAYNWYWESKFKALQTELTMLDQELVSNSLLLNLLREQQQNETTKLKRTEMRIAFLREHVFNKRAETVKKISESANAVLNSALAEDKYLSELAKQNLTLIDLLQLQLNELQSLLDKDNTERQLTLQVSGAFTNARQKLQLESDSSFIALSVRAQRETLPDSKKYIASRKKLLADIDKVSLRLFNHEEMLNTNEQALAKTLATDTHKSVEYADTLSELLENRQTMLERAITNDEVQRRGLYDLAARYLQLITTTQDYDDYLTKHLLWLKSSPAFNFIIFTQLPSELKQYLTHLKNELINMKNLSAQDIFFLFIPLLLALILLFIRRDLFTALRLCATKVGQIKEDSILHTVNALIYTTLLALPWGLTLFTLSWAFKLPATATNISVEIANAGIYTAISLFAVQFLKMLCISQGVAEIHFERTVKGLLKYARKLNLFIYFAIPCYFITLSAINLFPATLGGSLAILSHFAIMSIMVIIIVSILHPRRGLLYRAHTTHSEVAFQTRKMIFFLTMCLPAAIVIMFLAGYTYTAGVISDRLYFSIFFAALVWIFRSFLKRWLLITSRRLTYDNLVIARKAEMERTKSAGSEIHDLSHEELLEHEIDLKTLDGDTRRLINAAALVLTVLGLIGIWGQMLPALSFLEDIELWNKSLTVDGKEVLIAVTLDEVLIALLVSMAGYILSRNLPSLLDIILLKRGKISPGSRYAIVTLTRYSIVIITLIIAMTLLGISSARVGWVFAALSVGIGFGLQEVVANFICGLILLFERPIRVGDVITIGGSENLSGTVVRIRIRATTLRDFDEKELLIPNKELITGRVLNWTLTDETVRIIINVGIAYGSDVELAMKIIEEVAKDNERTIDEPATYVSFEQFADSYLSLNLRTYVAKQRDRLRTITEIHKEIDKRFRAAGVVIAFPQRDVHIISHEVVKPAQQP